MLNTGYTAMVETDIIIVPKGLQSSDGDVP